MPDRRVSRRKFVQQIGVAVGAVAFRELPAVWPANAASVAQRLPLGNIPNTPYKVGHMTFLAGPGAVLTASMLNGHLLAADEINARGGLLGRRMISTVSADESAGTHASVNELRRMKREAQIDAFTGVASSENISALAPVAEDLRILTVFVDGSTDLLFEHVVPRPRYVFRVNNLRSADGVACAVAVAKTWPEVRRVAFLNVQHWDARSDFAHFHVAIQKLLPGASLVGEVVGPMGTRDFAPMVKRIEAFQPELLISSLWGADYGTFYRQAMSTGLFGRMRVATTLAFSVAPHTIGKDHPEGVLAGVRSGYYWNLPSGSAAPANERFTRRYYARWKEYPNYAAEGAYTALHLLRVAIERASQVTGGWPDDEAIIRQLEGLTWDSPAGRIVIRPDNHQGYRDVMLGFTHHDARYPFTVLDPRRVIRIPISRITAPPAWPVDPPTAAYRWIHKTWPTAK